MVVRILVAGVAGGVAFFLSGFLIHGLLLRSFFDASMTASAKSVMNPEPNLVPLAIAQIIFGVLFAFIFDYWASISTFIGGAIGGAILMTGLGLAYNLEMLSFFKEMHTGSPVVPILVHLIAGAVMGAFAGGVVGQVLGMMKKS